MSLRILIKKKNCDEVMQIGTCLFPTLHQATKADGYYTVNDEMYTPCS